MSEDAYVGSEFLDEVLERNEKPADEVVAEDIGTFVMMERDGMTFSGTLTGINRNLDGPGNRLVLEGTLHIQAHRKDILLDFPEEP